MNKKAHKRLIELKERVDTYHIEVTNGFISYAYESESAAADAGRRASDRCDVCYCSRSHGDRRSMVGRGIH